jgi:hypothetical protein
MKIPITCTRCGKRYEVDTAFAGKRGKCASCGERMTIPDNDQTAPSQPESDAYQLDESHASEQATAFSPVKGIDDREDGQIRRRIKKRNSKSSPRLAEVAQIVADFTPKRRANRKISRFFGSENDLRSM